MRIRPEMIGGGRVIRPFNIAGERQHAGKAFSGEEVRAMPHANRQALIDNGFLAVWPMASRPTASAAGPAGASPTAAANSPMARHVSSRGFGRYDVIEGVKINSEPLSREEANALAGIAQEANKKAS